jgi:hypothetical protein
LIFHARITNNQPHRNKHQQSYDKHRHNNPHEHLQHLSATPQQALVNNQHEQATADNQPAHNDTHNN